MLNTESRGFSVADVCQHIGTIVVHPEMIKDPDLKIESWQIRSGCRAKYY